ncbi:hypothetical protein ROZALSC1DRAFT_26970, partial [Rozella allomycis CSF55]
SASRKQQSTLKELSDIDLSITKAASIIASQDRPLSEQSTIQDLATINIPPNKPSKNLKSTPKESKEKLKTDSVINQNNTLTDILLNQSKEWGSWGVCGNVDPLIQHHAIFSKPPTIWKDESYKLNLASHIVSDNEYSKVDAGQKLQKAVYDKYITNTVTELKPLKMHWPWMSEKQINTLENRLIVKHGNRKSTKKALKKSKSNFDYKPTRNIRISEEEEDSYKIQSTEYTSKIEERTKASNRDIALVKTYAYKLRKSLVPDDIMSSEISNTKKEKVSKDSLPYLKKSVEIKTLEFALKQTSRSIKEVVLPPVARQIVQRRRYESPTIDKTLINNIRRGSNIYSTKKVDINLINNIFDTLRLN